MTGADTRTCSKQEDSDHKWRKRNTWKNVPNTVLKKNGWWMAVAMAEAVANPVLKKNVPNTVLERSGWWKDCPPTYTSPQGCRSHLPTQGPKHNDRETTVGGERQRQKGVRSDDCTQAQVVTGTRAR